MKITLKCEYDGDTNKVIIITNTDYLPDALERLTAFLHACGFIFEGQLDIVKEDASKTEGE